MVRSLRCLLVPSDGVSRGQQGSRCVLARILTGILSRNDRFLESGLNRLLLHPCYHSLLHPVRIVSLDIRLIYARYAGSFSSLTGIACKSSRRDLLPEAFIFVVVARLASLQQQSHRFDPHRDCDSQVHLYRHPYEDVKDQEAFGVSHHLPTDPQCFRVKPPGRAISALFLLIDC